MTSNIRRICPENIPNELKEVDQWVVWKSLPAPGQPKPRKLPFCPKTGRAARTHNTPGKSYPNRPEDTWADYGTAWRVFQHGGYAGIGFVFTERDPFAGVDLDNCADPQTRRLTPDARAIIERLGTYTEFSPSGTGVKLICRAVKPAGRCRTGTYESYDRQRYFTVTGWHVGTSPYTCESRQVEYEAVYRSIFPAKEQPVIPPPAPRPPSAHTGALSDMDVLGMAFKAANGSKTAALYDGDLSEFGGDESSADASLAWRLAFYTRSEWGGGIGQLINLMENSALRRDKWYEPRAGTTWIEWECQKAINGTTEVYRPIHAPPGARKEAIRTRIANETK